MPSRLPPIPEHLRPAADHAGNGEVFWFREGAREAARWLAARDLAITGGEVYRRHSGAWGSYLREWTTEPGWQPDEPWSAFVARGAAQAVAAVEADPEGWDQFPDLPVVPLYFFACCAASEYRAPVAVA